MNISLFDSSSPGNIVAIQAAGGFSVYITSTLIALARYGVANDLTYTVTLTANTWYHVAITRAASTVRIFLNGVQGASGTVTSNYSATGTLTIGPQYSSNGYMSNIRIVKGVAVYTGNFTVPTSPLTSTQSAGTNISAVTGVQTSLLLNTPNTAGYLTDSSSFAATVTNNNTSVSKKKIKENFFNDNDFDFSGGNKIYDATTITGPLIYSLSGIISDEIVTISNYIASFLTPNVGLNTININTVILSLYQHQQNLIN
jgi:hypothetical protein